MQLGTSYQSQHIPEVGTHTSTFINQNVKLVPLAGFEWEARTLLYKLVDSAVGMAKQSSALREALQGIVLDIEEWEEIPVPVTPRTEKEEKYQQVLHEINRESATPPHPPAEQNLGRGRRKIKPLQAGKNDQQITSFFKLPGR